MDSQFYNVALDRIRYSLVWEDSNTLYHGLEINADDRVLAITSAGCNVLNTLLKSPQSVVAIDLNPVQNSLLLLKKHIITHHPHAVLRALMGLDGAGCVAEAWQQVAATLPAEMNDFWSAFFESHPEGILTAGRLESYITGFYHTLNEDLRQKLQQLIQFEEVEAQRDFFFEALDSSPFQAQFIEYFDNENLSKGRDPKLFKYAEESGGEAFYHRLVRQVSSRLLKDNFFFRFFLFGSQHLPESILPPCYQQQNYGLLRSQLHTLSVVNGEAIDYLLSTEGQLITKASLSNIFEYTSPGEFHKVCVLLFAKPDRNLRILFWNLLQDQGSAMEATSWDNPQLSEWLSEKEACFYFRNVRVKESLKHFSP